MATLIEVDKVKYECSCKRLKPLSSLYYCKFCKPFTLKCKECVLHEIDAKYFCANCFDNKMHKEASQTKFKCMNCFTCPCCKNTLMPRASAGSAAQKAAAQKAAAAAAATSVSTSTSGQSTDPSTPQQSTTPQQTKVFYLMCGFCRWTTRDVGIPDVTSIPGNWKIPENPHAKRVVELLEAYKVVSAREKLEKERKKYTTPKRRTFHTTSSLLASSSSSSLSLLGGVGTTPDKYGILGPISRRIKSSSALNTSVQEQFSNQTVEVQLQSLLKPAVTVNSFESLSDDYFTKQININSITTINQRHANPEFQPAKSSDLCPLNKFYVTKESKRCNGCEHNVLKPESNITSIKFKLHQMAMFMVPEVRIVKMPDVWKLDQPNEVILSVTNRTEIDLNVSFIKYNLSTAYNLKQETTRKEETDFRNLSNFVCNSEIEFDFTESIQIDRQDNSKTHSNVMRESDINTDGFVWSRRDNKIGIICKVTPVSEYLNSSINKNQLEIHCAFGLKHCLDQKAISDSSIQTQQQQQQPTNTQRNSVIQRVFINFGPIKI